MITLDFKVVTVSSNTNSFGLKQCIMVAKNGTAYKACANSLNIPKAGDVVSIPYIGEDNPTLSFSHKGFEIPEELDTCPSDAVIDIWNGNF